MSINPLNLIIQRSIPLVYDDSMSYMELLGAVVAKVNELVAADNAYFAVPLTTYVTQLLASWQADGTLNVIIGEALQTDMDALEQAMTELQADYDAWKVDIEALVQTVASVANAKRLDVLSANPTGADLYDGRIWLIKYLEQLVIDNLDAATLTSGAAGYSGTVRYKTSLNFKPTVNMSMKRVQIKLQSGDATMHSAAQNVRVRVCADDGSGKPDESVVFATSQIYGCPAAVSTLFIGECIFGTPVALTANTRYHLVLDVAEEVEKTFYRTFIYETGSPTNELSFNSFYSGSWGEIYEAYDPGIKIWKI